MKRPWSTHLLPLTLLAGLAIAACGDTPTSPEASCIAVVNVHDEFFGVISGPAPEPEAVSSEPYLTVTRNTGCLDQGEPSQALAHGESNFLPEGTTLHQIGGYEPTERLAFWSDVLEEWLVLSTLHVTMP